MVGEHKGFKFNIQVDHSKCQPTDDKMFLKGAWSPNSSLGIHPLTLYGFEQLVSAKLLGITLHQNIHFHIHVDNILKICSQRI